MSKVAFEWREAIENSRLTRIRYGSMMMTLAMIRDKFGGVETYCKINLGLTDQEIEAVRKNMVVEEPASVEI